MKSRPLSVKDTKKSYIMSFDLVLIFDVVLIFDLVLISNKDSKMLSHILGKFPKMTKDASIQIFIRKEP